MRNKTTPIATDPPTMTVGNVSGPWDAGTGVWGPVEAPGASEGIADGDTETGAPQEAPGASGGVGAVAVSVTGGAVGQPGE